MQLAGRAHMRGHRVPALALALTVLLSPAAGAQQAAQFTDERTGVDGWRFEGDGIRVQLIQRLPDQTKAFFLGRGFQPEAAARLAGRCLFQTIVHNTHPRGGTEVRVDLHDWRVQTPDGPEPLLLKETWQQVWSDLEVAEPARIAFQWAFFPTSQVFAPGDWNMGMTSYPVAPGEPVNVEIIWHENGERRRGLMQGPICGANEMAAEILK